MVRKTLLALFAVAGSWALVAPAQAQYDIPHSSTHIDYVPHTTTHFDHVRHGNHFDVVPHTTTHYDAVPHTTSHYDAVPYRTLSVGVGYQSFRPSYNSIQIVRPQIVAPYSSYRPAVRHTTTHLDVVPHRNHVHVVPHTTSHRHR